MAGGIISRILGFLNLDGDEDDYEYVEDAHEEQERAGRGRRGIFSVCNASRQDEIVVFDPSSIDEAKMVADNLKARCPVVVNLGGADEVMARRIVDFISGITYALDGHYQRLGDNIILFTPNNISISTAKCQDTAEVRIEE
ncbi:MAG: cell division protein SepF [bacterium]|jgi:cell division inhibitor SepF|nr:cell division protein SepF [bacterium]MDD3804726.1 cell division protein SepF [bacterium]MDD4152192.1 cell division protein SepF [bacterium]MDD4558348.1 cell division protein SepF [bacterium]